MDEPLLKGMLIDGVAGTESLDSQGERLSIEGADLSTLEDGRGRLNDNHGKTFTHSLGRILGAKKIFKKEDCEDDRQRMYWDKVNKPYIYIKGELFDDTEHPNAKATAAIMKHLHRTGAPLALKMSVEGSVLARREGGVLDRTKVHSVALTFTPANKETLAMPLDMAKSDEAVDWEPLIKSITVCEDAPSFIERASIEDRMIDATAKVLDVVHRVTRLKKALSAGYGVSAEPSGMVGGAVLQLPSIDKAIATCGHCGKRQMLVRNQTSCDGCGGSFSMERVAKNLLDD